MASSLTKSVDVMIAGEAPGPAKLKKGEKLGTAVWDLDRWLELVREGSL